MQQYRILTGLFSTLFLLSGITADAQLSGLIQKAKDKAGEVIVRKTDKNSDTDKSRTAYNEISTRTNFTRGDSLIFQRTFRSIKKPSANTN
jgi:hypothetical protein